MSAMGAQVLECPQVITMDDEQVEKDQPWQVILFNDEVHAIDEVIFQVQKATGASLEAAFEITMEVHSQGKAICFEGSLSKCERVAAILREIALSVEINQSAV